MYPTLLEIGNFRLDTYSVVWLIALSIAILWSIRRLKKYDVDEDKARSVMFWSFIAMLIGARSQEYIKHLNFYLANPLEFFNLNRGGLAETGAVTGAFVMAVIMCFIKRVSISKLFDVAAIPGVLAIAIGRWGCFLNGCCIGLRSKFFTAVHFPFDKADVFRHPVQIYYSCIAFLIVILLLMIERKINTHEKNYYAILTPLALIFYTCMRFLVAPMREYLSINLLLRYSMTYKTAFILGVIGAVWLVVSLLMRAFHNTSLKFFQRNV